MDKLLAIVSRLNGHLVPAEDAEDLSNGATFIPFAVTEARRQGQTVKFEVRNQSKFYDGKLRSPFKFWVMPDGTRLLHDSPDGPRAVYEDDDKNYPIDDDWFKLCCLGLPKDNEKPCGYAFSYADGPTAWMCVKHSANASFHEAAEQAVKDGTHSLGNCSGFPEFKVIHWQK